MLAAYTQPPSTSQAPAELGAPDCLFAYCSTWPSSGNVLTEFSNTCGGLRVGTRVVTTDRRLRDGQGFSFALVDALEGPNVETGGTSVGYVYEVQRSWRAR